MTIKIGWQVACHDGTDNDTPLFGNVVLQDQVTNQNHYISTISISMATKLGRIVTYIYFFLPLNITWQNKIIVSLVAQYLWQQNLA